MTCSYFLINSFIHQLIIYAFTSIVISTGQQSFQVNQTLYFLLTDQIMSDCVRGCNFVVTLSFTKIPQIYKKFPPEFPRNFFMEYQTLIKENHANIYKTTFSKIILNYFKIPGNSFV